ncbi:MAG: hypothetical protein M1823_006074, partial [Watsoniomyces obsoletus]
HLGKTIECSRCERTRPADDFSLDNDGLPRKQCKFCLEKDAHRRQQLPPPSPPPPAPRRNAGQPRAVQQRPRAHWTEPDDILLMSLIKREKGTIRWARVGKGHRHPKGACMQRYYRIRNPSHWESAKGKKMPRWAEDEDKHLMQIIERHLSGKSRNLISPNPPWKAISEELGGRRTPNQCYTHYYVLRQRVNAADRRLAADGDQGRGVGDEDDEDAPMLEVLDTCRSVKLQTMILCLLIGLEQT